MQGASRADQWGGGGGGGGDVKKVRIGRGGLWERKKL